MKPLGDLLFKLRHSVATGTFAVLDPVEAQGLLDVFRRRDQLLIDARSLAGGLRIKSPEELAKAIDEEFRK